MRYDNSRASDTGSPTITFTDNVFVELRNDWLQLPILSRGSKWNWYDMSIALLQFHVEKDKVFSGWDVDIRFLGFGIRLRWNTTPNESTKKIIDETNEKRKDK